MNNETNYSYLGKALSEECGEYNKTGNRIKLVREAVYIYDDQLSIYQNKFDYAIRDRLRGVYSLLKEYGRDLDLNDNQNDKTLVKIYRNLRNYLAHIIHKPVILTIEETKLLQYIHRAILRVINECSNHELKDISQTTKFITTVNGKDEITLWGAILLIAMGLDRKTANEFLSQFGLFKEYLELKQCITKYCPRPGLKAGVSKPTQTSYTHWQHFNEIIEYISTPLPKNLDFLKDNHKANSNQNKPKARRMNSAMVDYFILRWLELNPDWRIEFAIQIPKKNQLGKMINKPCFEGDDDFQEKLAEIKKEYPHLKNEKKEAIALLYSRSEYYRHNHQYWMRINRNKDLTLKIHSRQLPDLAIGILNALKENSNNIDEVKNKIIPAIKWLVHDPIKLPAPNKNQLPRTLRIKKTDSSEAKTQSTWKPASLQAIKEQRIRHYEKIIRYNQTKLDTPHHCNTLHHQSNFILWALQHGIGLPQENFNENPPNGAHFSSSQYNNLNFIICQYSDKGNFKAKVIEGIHNILSISNHASHRLEHPFIPYIMDTIPATVVCLAIELINRLNATKENELPSPDQQLRPREHLPNRNNHYLAKLKSISDNLEKNPLDIPWLPKSVQLGSHPLHLLPDWELTLNNYHYEITDISPPESVPEEHSIRYHFQNTKETEKQIANIKEAIYSGIWHYQKDKLLQHIAKHSYSQHHPLPQKNEKTSKPSTDEITFDFNKQSIRLGDEDISFKNLNKVYLSLSEDELLQIYKDYQDYQKLNNKQKKEANKSDKTATTFIEYLNTVYNSQRRQFNKLAIARIFDLEQTFYNTIKNELSTREQIKEKKYLDFKSLIEKTKSHISNEDTKKLLDNLLKHRKSLMHFDHINQEDQRKMQQDIDTLCKLYQLSTLTSEINKFKQKRAHQRTEGIKKRSQNTSKRAKK